MDEPDALDHQAGTAPTGTAPAGSPPTGAAVSCAWCGTTVATPPITWMYEFDRNRGGRWYCQNCARLNLRAVEAKLNQQWW